MLLEDKNAVIYGAGGAIGSGVAKAFARERARVFLAGRTLETLATVAKDIQGIPLVDMTTADFTRAITNRDHRELHHRHGRQHAT